MVSRMARARVCMQGAYGAHASSCLQSVDGARLSPFLRAPAESKLGLRSRAEYCHSHCRLVWNEGQPPKSTSRLSTAVEKEKKESE